jgi:diguanylate cyclase (GGDEF)-like protein
MDQPIIIIGPASDDYSALQQAGYTCEQFNDLDSWWQQQTENPKAFIIQAQQTNTLLNGFEMCRVIKRMPVYQALPVIIYEPTIPTCPTQQYECHMDAYCNSMDDIIRQLKTVTTMFTRVWSPPEMPVPFSQIAQAWDYTITQKQLQSDLHQLTTLLPDISSSVHMAFSLFERIFPYQAAGLLLCSNHPLIQNIFYVTVPYGSEPLAPLSQQYLATNLTEKLKFKLNNPLRIEDLAGTVTSDMPFKDFPLQLTWPFGTQAEPMGAVAFWGEVPIANTDIEKTVHWWLKDWFKQVSWIRQLHHGEYLDTVTQTYQYAYLMRQLHAEVNRAKRYEHPICVLKIMVDQLDTINYQYGFDVGDKVLRVMAELLQSSIRQADLLGRYRTNEFLVLMPETSLNEAEAASSRILDRVSQTVIPLNTKQGNQSACEPTIRIGITCLLDGQGDVEDLLKSAHQASQAANSVKRMVTTVVSSTTKGLPDHR